jgi:hypothetical protein
LQAFAKVDKRPNRKILLRVALETDGGGDAQPVKKTTGAGTWLTTAALIGDLTDALKDDDHLEPSLAIPAKENGLDVEGLAVFGHRVLLGLRGWATVLEVEPTEDPEDPTRLRLGSPPYRKHFLELGDLRVRDPARRWVWTDPSACTAGATPPASRSTSPPSTTWSAGGDEPEQQLGAGVVERGEPEFVDDDVVVARQGVDHPADAVVGQAAVEGLDELGGGEVADSVPGGDRGGKRFSSATSVDQAPTLAGSPS